MRTFIVAICIVISHFAGAKDYTINLLESVQSEQQKKSVEQFFTVLYQPLGIQPKFVYYPSTRGLKLVGQGVLDAEASRFPVVAKQYPNLMQVPESLGEFHSGLFCLSEQSCRMGKEAAIALEAGFESASQYCKKNQLDCRKETQVSNITKLVDEKWVDAALLQTMFATQVVCSSKHTEFHVKLFPELRSSSYHYVHISHKSLVMALAKSVKEIKLSDQYQNNGQVWVSRLEACGKTIHLVR